MGPRRRGYLILLGVFLLGALSGGSMAYAWWQRSFATLIAEEPSEARDLRRLRAFAHELELDEDQQEAVRQIVEKFRPERERRARRMFDGCGQPLLRLKDEMDSEIRKVLRTDQQPRFDELRQRRRRFHQGPH